MDIAEVKNKLPRDSRYDEDVLTSSVFGLLEFVRPEICMIPWLRSARNLEGQLLLLLAPVSDVHIEYWPLFPELGDRTETDVLVSLHHGDGSADLVAIEIKYQSGPSGWPTSSELDPKVRGQLGREWSIVATMPPGRAPGNPRRLERRLVIYVTSGSMMPRNQLEVMVVEVEEKNGKIGFRSALSWLSWLDLAPVVMQVLAGSELEKHERTALQRLLALLQKRRLRSLSGVYLPISVPNSSWQYRRKQYDWTAPQTIVVPSSYTRRGPQ